MKEGQLKNRRSRIRLWKKPSWRP